MGQPDDVQMPDDVQIETLADPQRYAAWQLEFARRVAVLLGGGRLVLCEKPLG